MTGASREDLVGLFSSRRILPSSVQLLRGKSYSFASFSSCLDAAEAFEAFHGKEGISEDRPPLYLAYVDRFPQVEAAIGGGEDWKSELPPGLLLLTNFVSEEEEADLLRSVCWKEDDGEGKALKNRQVRHFGHDFVYGSNSISEEPNGRPFPTCWGPLLDRAVRDGHLPEEPDQCTANR